MARKGTCRGPKRENSPSAGNGKHPGYFHTYNRDFIPQRDVAREGARNNYGPQN